MNKFVENRHSTKDFSFQKEKSRSLVRSMETSFCGSPTISWKDDRLRDEERDHVGNIAMQRKMANEVRMSYSSQADPLEISHTLSVNRSLSNATSHSRLLLHL